MIAHKRAQIAVNHAVMLNRQIRYAAPCIELIGSGKGIGRANIQTGRAHTAMVVFRRIGQQFKRGENRAQKQPRTKLARHQIRVLALPAQTGAHGQRLFHDRCRVDKDFHLSLRFIDEPTGQRLQFLFNDIMIIAPLRIDRNHALIVIFQGRQGVAFGAVIDPQHDNALRFRP